MKQSLKSSLIYFFEQLPDPRVEGRCKHELIDIVVISICALLCGAESWVEIAEFGRQRIGWFKKYLKLDNGIPSHDTFARVFSLLKPEAFEKLFFEWANLIKQQSGSTVQYSDLNSGSEQLCVDGKSISGTAGHNSGNSALHLVSVYSHSTGLVLGQAYSKASGSGESSAVLECLESLDIQGALVSADAANATKKVTNFIREKKADYLVPLKSHAKKYLVQRLELNNPKPLSIAEQKQTKAQAHGRYERRRCKVFSADKLGIDFKNNWMDVCSVIEITRTRKVSDLSNYALKPIKTTIETMYYISSRNLDAFEAMTCIRDHWSIENQLHWNLDVSFREDDWKIIDKKAARTLALVRKIAFNLLKSSNDSGSMKVKIKRAAWNQKYLEQLLFKHPF